MDLSDEGGDFAGGGFGEVGRLYGADDGEAVAVGEVGPGVVIGEQFAVCGGDGGDGGFDGGVQAGDAGGEGVVVGVVVGGVVRVMGGEAVADDGGVALRQDGVGPEVGVGMSGDFGEGEVEAPFGAGDGLVAEADDGGAVFEVGAGHCQGWLLEEEAVEEYQVGGGEDGGDGRGGLEGVGVHALGDDALEVDARAADVFHDAGDGRHGGYYIEGWGGGGRGRWIGAGHGRRGGRFGGAGQG